jgi:hypothetical protein
MIRYPHTCADEHQPIGHSDSEQELCPLCRALNALEALEQAYSNKHSPQHRAASLSHAQAVLNEMRPRCND